CRLRGVQPEAGGDPRGLVDRLVVGVHGLLLVLRKGRPRLGRPRRRGVALMDQQHVLHGSLLLGMVTYETSGERRNRQPPPKTRRPGSLRSSPWSRRGPRWRASSSSVADRIAQVIETVHRRSLSRVRNRTRHTPLQRGKR